MIAPRAREFIFCAFRPAYGRSAQKIISRARCNHLARNPHSRTKLINYLARNPSVISHDVSLAHRTNTQTPLGGISNLILDESEGRQPISPVCMLSRGGFETIPPFFWSSELPRDFLKPMIQSFPNVPLRAGVAEIPHLA